SLNVHAGGGAVFAADVLRVEVVVRDAFPAVVEIFRLNRDRRGADVEAFHRRLPDRLMLEADVRAVDVFARREGDAGDGGVRAGGGFPDAVSSRGHDAN